MNEILCTKDYGVFRPHPMQRKVKPGLVVKLMKSMQKRGFVPTSPITVNSRMEVVDGQNRLQSAKNLGLCVYYVVNDAIEVDDIREMAQAQSKWILEDYITSQIRQGHESYIRLLGLKELSGLSWHAILSLMYGSHTEAAKQLRAGSYSLSDTREAETMDFIGKLDLFKDYQKIRTSHYFAGACARMFRHPDYDHKQMTSRIAYQSSKLVRCSSSQEYLIVLNDIYNYKSHAHKVVDLTKERRAAK